MEYLSAEHWMLTKILIVFIVSVISGIGVTIIMDELLLNNIEDHNTVVNRFLLWVARIGFFFYFFTI